jgi:ABC-type polysaccharide/polyol phosphate transport system ATPase subunit
MARIDLRSVSVEFPIYNMNARSIKKDFLRLATGGTITEDTKQRVIIRALTNLNLTLEHGDRVGIIGHNGAGKSTLLRLLATIYEPTYGDIKIDGHVSPMLDLMQGIEAELTGFENITLRGTLLDLDQKEIRQRTQEIAELTGLGDYLAMPMRTYSAGMRVRLAFAISASVNPEILLIDEIFNAVDAEFMQTAQRKLASLLGQSSIVVMANHSEEIIREFCNKAILLEHGKLKYFGDVKEALRIYHQNTI